MNVRYVTTCALYTRFGTINTMENTLCVGGVIYRGVTQPSVPQSLSQVGAPLDSRAPVPVGARPRHYRRNHHPIMRWRHRRGTGGAGYNKIIESSPDRV